MAEDLIDYELDGEAPDDIEPIQGEPELYEHFRTVVDKGQAPVRIDKYLFERIVNASRNRIQMAADNGFVMANGKPVKSSYKVKPLDVLTVMVEVDEKYFSDEIRKLDELKNKVAAVLKQALGVAVRVKLVEPKTIERSEGKAKRVIDNRGL